VLLDMMYQ